MYENLCICIFKFMSNLHWKKPKIKLRLSLTTYLIPLLVEAIQVKPKVIHESIVHDVCCSSLQMCPTLRGLPVLIDIWKCCLLFKNATSPCTPPLSYLNTFPPLLLTSHFTLFSFFCWRCVPLSRWVLPRPTTVSSWTSKANECPLLCQAVWTHLGWVPTWHLPIWVAHRWEWISLGLAWTLSAHMVKGCLSKATLAPDLSRCPCRALKGHTQERWAVKITPFFIFLCGCHSAVYIYP